MNPFRSAAKYIQSHGWITGEFGTPKAGVCAVGALRYAWYQDMTGFDDQTLIESDFEVSEMREAEAYEVFFTNYLQERYPDLEIDNIPDWNDRKVKNADEVVEEFKLAAEEWDLREQSIS